MSAATTPTRPSSAEAAQSHPDVPKFRPRACARCSQSKLKCTWTSDPGEAPCERCARSRSECVLPSLKPRGGRRANPTRVGQLEQKIDGIMSLLTASQHIQQNLRPLKPAGPGSASGSGTQELPKPLQGGIDQEYPYLQANLAPPASSRQSVVSETAALPLLRVPPLEHVEIVPGLKITFHDAEQALSEYRAVFSPYFPFIPLPPDISAFDLYQTQPFLFRTLVQVALPQDPQMQRDVQHWFREYIAKHVVVDQEKNLELLQAILVFAGWGDFSLYLESKATSLLQLAIGLALDLGLSKSPTSLGWVPYALEKEVAIALKGIKARRAHTIEDMRAMLGCFYVASIISTLFRRPHIFPHTAYLDRCCDTLLEVEQYSSDKFLVALVHMQRLVSRIYALFPNPESDSTAPRVFFGPLQMTIATIRKEVDALAEKQDAEVERNFFFWTHYHATITRLYEPLIYMRPASDPEGAARRTEGLWNCLQSLSNFFATYLSIPVEAVGALPFVATAHLSFAVITSTRLLFLEDANWNVKLARESLDFAAICARLEDHFQAAEAWEVSHSMEHDPRNMGRKRRFASGGDRSALATSCGKIRGIRQWYISRLPVGERRQGDVSAADNPAMDVDPAELPDLPGDIDGAFWQALLSLDGEWGSFEHA